MNSPTRAELVALLAGELDAATLATRHGLSDAELGRLQAAFLEGLKAGAEPRVPRFRHGRLLAAALVVAATAAFAQLVTFTADSPAIASQVNGNFTQLRTWIEQKVGTVGNNNISTSGNISLGSTTRQMLNLYNADYGVGVQSSTLYYRSGGQHAWYRAGGHSDAALNNGGGVTQMTLSDTLLTVNGGLQANGGGGNVPHACVVRQGPGNSHMATCNAGEIAVGGGGRCNSHWRLTESLPWGGPADANVPVSGQPARAWRSVCQVWGDNGAYAVPQQGHFVICCRQ